MPARLAAIWICLLAACWGQSGSSALPSYYIYNLAGSATAGNLDGPTPLFDQPQGIWFDSASSALFVADTANNMIRRIDVQIGAQGPQNIVATTVAGSGYSGVGGCKQPGDTMESTTVPALAANIWGPQAVAVDSGGTLYIADTNNNCVRQLSGSSVITYAGNGLQGQSGGGDGGNPLLASIMPGPMAFFQQTNLLITDFTRVRLVENDMIQTVAGGGEAAPVTSGSQAPTSVSLGQVFSIASNPAGNTIYIANASMVFTLSGGSLQYFIGGSPPLTVTNVPEGVYLRNPQAMAIDVNGNLLIADTQYHVILRVTPGGSVDVIAGMNGDPGSDGDSTPLSPALATNARLNTPMGLAADSSGNIYIADTANNRIRVLVPTTGAMNPSTTASSTAPPGKIYGAVDTEVSPAAGDPVTIATGNVFVTAADYRSAGQNQLNFYRYYNSRGDASTLATSLGVNWRSTYDRYIRISSPSSVVAERPDGKMITFTSQAGAWATDTDVDLTLTQSGSTWTLTDPADAVETYTTVSSNEALLNSIQARNGYTRILTYDGNNHLIAVTDSYNRCLNLTYSGSLLQTVATPDGLTLSYNYASSGVTPGVMDQLTAVSYSTDPVTSRSYLYENSTVPFALTGILDEDGNRYSSWTYDSLARALTSQLGAGAEMATITYNDSDGSRMVTNGLGQQVVYRFTTLQNAPKPTEIDRLASSSVPAASRSFTYDGNGYVASQTDWNGNQTTYVRNARGEPLTITEAVGTPQQRTASISYHSTFHLPLEMVAPGITIDYVYDDSGNLLTSTQTDTTTYTLPYSTNGQTRTWTYTWVNGLLASAQSPRTDATGLTQFTYDSSGAAVSITNALGQTTQIAQHLPGGLPQTIIDPNGVSRQLTYDARSRLLSSTIQTAAGPLTTSYTYDAAGNMIDVTRPDGSAFTISYDGARRLTGVGDLLQQTLSYSLDTLGNPTQQMITAADGTPQFRHTSSYDSIGRLLTDVGGAGQTSTYTYDANGNQLTATDPLTRVSRQTLDALNRPVAITDAGNGSTAITYDAFDRPLSITDANGATTTYLYDGFGELIQQVSPDSGPATLWYDADGNLVQKVDATGAVANYTYDALDRAISATYPADPAENVTAAYDEAGYGFSIGQLTTLNDAAGTLTRSYDERGNVLSETRTIGAATLLTAYSYDANGRIASVTYPSGWQVANTRDVMGRITGISAQDPAGDPSVPLLSGISYQPYGPLNAMIFGNGVSETRSFDQDYRLTNLLDNGSGALQNLTYGYDADDNPLSVRDGINAGNSQSFQFDPLNRLTNAMGSYGTLGFTYDHVGNRLTQTAGPAISTYTYTPQTNQLASLTVNGAVQNFSYTAAGSVSSFSLNSNASYNLTYNQAGRLATVTAGSQPLAQYTYDSPGHRVAKTGAATTLYQYDVYGRLIEETDDQGNPLVDYLYLGTMPVATLSPATGQVYYLHNDRLGTPQLATDANQAVAWSASYHPFGALNSTPALIVQNLRLPGQENDSDTGLYQNGFRDYVPSLGRYLESDPLGLAAGPNTYAYAGGNPVTYTDPSGLDSGLPPTGDVYMLGVGAPANLSNDTIDFPIPDSLSFFTPGFQIPANLYNFATTSHVGATAFVGLTWAIGGQGLSGAASEDVAAVESTAGAQDAAAETSTSGAGNPSSDINPATDPAPPEGYEWVYRGDKRPPEVIKEAGGFKPWGNNYNIHGHIADPQLNNSGFVSTAKLESKAADFGKYGYVYRIARPKTAIDVNEFLGSESSIPWETEFVSPGGIDNWFIRAVRTEGTDYSAF